MDGHSVIMWIDAARTYQHFTISVSENLSIIDRYSVNRGGSRGLLSSTLNTTKMAKTIAIFLYSAVFLAALVCADKELPTELRDPSMFCEGCFGTISEVSAMMEETAGKGSKLNGRVEKVLGKVCHTDNLRKYVFSPPKMVKVKPASSLQS